MKSQGNLLQKRGFEQVQGIQHDGGYDDAGQLCGSQHYYAILKYNGLFHVVNQVQNITQSLDELAMCQIFLYKKVDLRGHQGLSDDDIDMNCYT